MFVPIEPIAASAPSGGLRRSTTEVRDGARWESGFAWLPERCPTARTFDPCAGNVAEIVTATVTGGPTGGTMTFSVGAQTTAATAFNAAASLVLTRLEALSNVNPGDLTVSGPAGGPYVITWRADIVDPPTITANGAGLTGGTAPAVNVVTTQAGSTVYGARHGDNSAEQVYHRPVGFRVDRTCTTLGGAVQVDEESVRKQADAITSYEMARELWTGERTQANPFVMPEGGSDTNRYLASADATVIAGGFTPLDGLGVVEEEARAGNLGMDVVIHVPIQLVPHIAEALVRTGNILHTHTGALVVADAGYPGTSPEGELEEDRRWIYATSTVNHRLSEIITDAFVDQRANRRTVVAERLFATYFDPCTHYGLAVVVPTPAADPA